MHGGATIEYVDWLTEKKGTSYRGTIRLLPNMPPAEGFPACGVSDRMSANSIRNYGITAVVLVTALLLRP
jgi:hypothetical protein